MKRQSSQGSEKGHGIPAELVKMLLAAGRYVYLENARQGPTTPKDLAYCVRMMRAMGEDIDSRKMSMAVERLMSMARRDRSNTDEYLLSWESEPYDTSVAIAALASVGRTIADPAVSAAADWIASEEDTFRGPSLYGEIWETSLSCHALMEAGYYSARPARKRKLAEQVGWAAETAVEVRGRLGDHYAGTVLQLLSAARAVEPGAVSPSARRRGDVLADHLANGLSTSRGALWTDSPWANGRCLDGLVSWRPQWAADAKAVRRVTRWFGEAQGEDGSWYDSMVETHDSFLGLLALAGALHARRLGLPAEAGAWAEQTRGAMKALFAGVRAAAPDPVALVSQTCPRGDPQCSHVEDIAREFKTPNAFMAIPFNSYEDRRERIVSVLKDAGFQPRDASDVAGAELFCAICRGIRAAHFIVSDVSQQGRGNMPLELGLALGLGKQTCLLYRENPDPDNAESFPPDWISDLKGRKWEQHSEGRVDRAIAQWMKRERVLAPEEVEARLGAYLT